jgi:hypothetical protein
MFLHVVAQNIIIMVIRTPAGGLPEETTWPLDKPEFQLTGSVFCQNVFEQCVMKAGDVFGSPTSGIEITIPPVYSTSETTVEFVLYAKSSFFIGEQYRNEPQYTDNGLPILLGVDIVNSMVRALHNFDVTSFNIIHVLHVIFFCRDVTVLSTV